MEKSSRILYHLTSFHSTVTIVTKNFQVINFSFSYIVVIFVLHV